MSKDILYKDDKLVKQDETPAANSIRLAKKGLMGGLIFSIIPLHSSFQTHSLLLLAGRCLGSYAIPFGLTAATFGAVTSLLDDYRGKDKPVTNAFVGGFVAGVVYGSRTLHPWKAFQTGCMLGAAGAIARFVLIDERLRDMTEAEKLMYNTVYISKMSHLKP